MGDPTRNLLVVPGTDDAMNHAAALAICARARDKADAVLLLTVCGLLPEGKEAA